MSTSKILADRTNLDLRHIILDILECIYLATKDKGRYEQRIRENAENAESALSFLQKRSYMISSFREYYKMDPKIEIIETSIGKVKEGMYEGLEEKLSPILVDLENKFNERIRQGLFLKEKELSLTDRRIMGFIGEHGPCDIEYISDHTLCSKETLKESLRKLIQKGYIREDNKGNYV